MATQQHTSNNTPQEPPIRTLLKYIKEWIESNVLLVLTIPAVLLFMSYYEDEYVKWVGSVVYYLGESTWGYPLVWITFGLLFVILIYRINSRDKKMSNADSRTVYAAVFVTALFFFTLCVTPQDNPLPTPFKVTLWLGMILLWWLCFIQPLMYFLGNKRMNNQLEEDAEAYSHLVRYIDDEPVADSGEDALVHKPYVPALINCIRGIRLGHTGSIAITGSWGAGKSSFVKMLEEELKSDDYKDEFIFLTFEPMRCERPELIQSAFLDQLEAALSQYRTGFARHFRLYKELIGAVDNKYLGFVTTLFSITQEEEFDRIQRAIQSLHRHVVVFIDDVDRLERDELVQIFRLVRFNAKFNNLVFLLAMDKTKVEATMGATDNFSDKFAETEFYLPRMRPNDIVKFVIDMIKISSISQYAKQAIENDLGGNVADIVKHCLPTMRDAKRFVNSFLLRLELMDKSDEYIFRDYYLLSLLHYADPNAFDVLAQNESFGADVVHKGLTINRSNLCGAKSESDDILWRLVQTLFPDKGVIQVVGARHGINDNDYIFIYFNEVYRSSSASAQSNGQVPPSPQPKPNTPQGPQPPQSPQSGQSQHTTQDTQGPQPQKPNTPQGPQPQQSPQSGQSQHTTQGTQGPQPQKPNTPQGPQPPQSPQSGQNQHTTQGTQESQPQNPNTPQGPQPPQTPANLNVFSVANMQYLLSLPTYDEIYKLLFTWKKDDALYANVKKYFEDYQIDKLPNDDPRVGKYFIVRHILGIEELDFQEGLAAVEKGGKWGYVDTDGKVKISFDYDFAWSVSDKLIAVKKEGKWGFIDKTGAVIIPFGYDEAEPFFTGHARVKKDEKRFYINKKGKRAKKIGGVWFTVEVVDGKEYLSFEGGK